VSNNGGSSTASFFNSGSGVVLNLTATSGTAMTATTTSGSEAARITVNPSSTNTTVTVLNVRRLTSGTAAANMAGSIEYNMEVNLDGSSTAVSNKLISMWTDAANATRGSKFIIQGVTNAVNTDVVEFLGDGNVRQLVTGKGYGLKSPDGTTWYITVNNSGVLSTSTTAP
jgi:expansin (peptidoglycan-binding protein)